ncbi:MAG: acyl-CoA dehydrogenase family protein [Cellvibrio sp.]
MSNLFSDQSSSPKPISPSESQGYATHQVFNQPPAFAPENLYAQDQVLQEHLACFGVKEETEILTRYGRITALDLMQAGEFANRYPPELRAFDRFGHRIEQVDYHPAYHQLMSSGIEAGIVSMPWESKEQNRFLLRAALHYLHMQADAGSGCPLTMTFSAYPLLNRVAKWREPLISKLLARRYDPRNISWQEKSSITAGMAMTEKQGGSDVRANTTCATACGDDRFSLVGHKWFCSAPMSDFFLTLAQLPEGLSCFLVPRFRLDGGRNAMELQRLKHKLGNHSNASSEIEYRGAEAYLVGDRGRGVATIIDMVSLTRVDCMLGSAALMQRALVEAFHYGHYRKAFGVRLIDSPLMQNVLADIAIEQEASLAFFLWLVSLQEAPNDARASTLLRLLTPVGKYFICKRASWIIAEASEILGGAGYIEEQVMPRLYREAPVNSIWEGSGNVQCLDVLRVLKKQSDVIAVCEQEFACAKHPSLQQFCEKLLDHLTTLTSSDEVHQQAAARHITEQLALAFMGLRLENLSSQLVADAFMASRLDVNNRSLTLGCLPSSIDCAAILARRKSVIH